LSVFYKDESGRVHTYSAYARGIDMVNSAYYHYLDLIPKARDEEGRPPQYWVRRCGEYGR